MSALAKLAQNHPESSKTQLIVHFSKTKEDLGQILIMAEIEKAPAEALTIIKKLIAETQAIYFSENTKSLEKALENTLQKINIIISEIVKKETDIWLQNLNMAIVAYKENEVYFSKVGKIRVFLVNEKSITDVAGEHKTGEKINIIKAFANIFSGQINIDKNESLTFLTETVLDYISQDKIKKIIVNSPTAFEALKELENLLKKAPKSKSFASILILEKSVNSLEKRNAGAVSVGVLDKPTKAVEKDESEIESLSNSPAEIKEVSQSKILNRASYYNKMKPTDLANKFKQMPILSKMSIVFFVIIIILLINTFRAEKPLAIPQPALDNTFEISLSKIKAAQIEANSAFMAEDATAAKNSLKLARELLVALTEDTEERKIIKQELTREVNKDWLKALGIKNLENLSAIADFSAIIKEINTRELFKKDDNLYTYNANDFLSLLKYNLKNGKTEKIPITADSAPKIAQFVGSLEQKLIFYSQEGKNLAALNLEDNKISALDWGKTEAVASPADFAIYQDKLYILDTSAKQIFKYQKTISGFASESKWLAAVSDLSNVASFAIDGNIWVLNKNGEILKFFKGKTENFSYAIEPKLEAPTKIYTQADALYLYILDPATRRIAVLNKTGALIAQFTSDSFDDLRDLAVDEIAKKIYVLNGEKVYEVGF